MTGPTERNRLDEEESPYLQAHADNPVNWQPWDDLALDAAKERDVPIFLSIGYSSCHWCHVMAEESFEDPAIADRLNEAFVPVKVDREERPDVDSIYMTVCRQVSPTGCGWPLSAFLTPDGRAFFVGTYFPKESKHGRPGFGDLLDRISTSWETEREGVEERATQWMAAARGELESVPEPADAPPGSDLLTTAADEFVRSADRRFGGFGSGQKFPQVGRLRVLARAANRDTDAAYRDVLTESLDAMAEGGLRDQLGGGFHRYCVDRNWTVPHFEKMLYDNAEIPRAFLAGYRLTGDQRYADVARETFEFVDAELTHPEGGFFSTLDARSHPPGIDDPDGRGEEGVFYTWTPESVMAAMGEYQSVDESDERPSDLAEAFNSRYGVTETGNFEGTSVLTQSASVEEVAQLQDATVEDAERTLEIARGRAHAARDERPRPPRDEKILAGWNGLMVASLAEGALVLDDDRYADRAAGALSFVQEQLWDGAQLSHRYKDGDVKGSGYLEDYAFLARGALALHGVTGDLEPLAFALDLGRQLVDRFWDANNGTLYFTDVSDTSLDIRPQELADQSTPSSTGVAVEVLEKLDAFAPKEGFGDVVEGVLTSHASQIESAPGMFATLALAADDHALGTMEVTVAGDSIPADWRAAIGSEPVAPVLLTRRPATDDELTDWLDELSIEDAPPIWAGREARDGPTAYVCRRACSPPVHSAADILDWLDEFGAVE